MASYYFLSEVFSAVLQSHNHFYPGFAAALYNLGIIIGIVFLTPFFGIYSAAYGVIFGSIYFYDCASAFGKDVKFSLKPVFSLNPLKDKGSKKGTKADVAKNIINRNFSVWYTNYSYFLFHTCKNLEEIMLFLILRKRLRLRLFLIGNAIAQAAFPYFPERKTRLKNSRAHSLQVLIKCFILYFRFQFLFLFLEFPLSVLFMELLVLTGRRQYLLEELWHSSVFQYLLSR